MFAGDVPPNMGMLRGWSWGCASLALGVSAGVGAYLKCSQDESVQSSAYPGKSFQPCFVPHSVILFYAAG